MKRFVSAALGLVALAAATPASAADLPRSMPYKAPVMMSVFNWTGFYAGIHTGYGWASSNGIDLQGWFLGGQLGYNWQAVGSPWVFGIEFDSAWADMGRTDTFATGAGVISVSSRAHYMGSLRGRIGHAWDRTMLYVTGGVAWVNNRLSVNTTVGGFTSGLSDTQTHFGGTIGLGVEHAFAPNWTGKIEYLYTSYGSKTYFAGIAGGVSADADSHALKVGLNYLFR
jgi:outer membrane immunogenic protein